MLQGESLLRSLCEPYATMTGKNLRAAGCGLQIDYLK